MTIARPARAGEPSAAERLEEIWSDAPGLVGFFTSVNHKRVGIRYLVTTLVLLALGGVEAMFMRSQLMVAENQLLSPELYNQIMTMHGTTMIFLFNTPVWSGFGNYVLPLQIGARDMAFPRLNMLTYWVFLLSAIFIYSSFLIGSVPSGGWFAYPPFTEKPYSPSLGMDFWAVGIIFAGISTTAGAVNFLVTVFKMRAPGMTASRIPIFTWSIIVMSFVILFSFPAITLAPLLLELDRLFNFSFFRAAAGGDPVLYQHLFWIWGHPEVYIVFIPATGVISTLVTVFARHRLVLYPLAVAALVGIGFISFGVWVHHMFVVGLGFLALAFFAAASFMVSIPSGIQFFIWIATLWKGRPRFGVPLLWTLGAMFVFLVGGITGVMVAIVPFDFQAHDSYFVVAHFHYTLIGGSVFPVFAALYYWLPKMVGRVMNPTLGKLSFWITFVAFNVTFFPMHIVGLLGMPRRYYTYQEELGWEPYNMVETFGAYVLALGFGLSLFNFVFSRYFGRPAPDDPFGSYSLEWATTSPPGDYNFVGIPRVSSGYPLWEPRPHGEGVEQEPERGRPQLLPPPGVEEHYALATGGIDAEPEAVMPMPEPSPYPFFVALGFMWAFSGVLIREFWWGMGGVFVVLFTLLAWFWPTWEEDEEVELAGEEPAEAVR